MTIKLESALGKYNEQLDAVRMKSSQLQGKRLTIALQAQDTSEKVSMAKARLECADEVALVFKEMQTRAHARAVNLFERLLTAILNDVLPGQGSICLDMGMKGNQASLDVNLIDSRGNKSDVLNGNGGALTNIVSAGLRFAALSRTANRRFMVLDEPDCWIKPSLVPAFMKVLSDVSIKTATQTIFVSHYPMDSFGPQIARVKLSRDANGKIQAVAEEAIMSRWENDTDEGIRSIELINFMAHQHTVIPCFPGATALIGDNNLGKSVLARAMKAVAYNESSDSQINYQAKDCKIIIHLEDNQKLIWSRNPKRNPVVLYEWFHGDTLVSKGRPTNNSVPEFVFELLGIDCVNKLDVQISDQKSPVFLLDEPSTVRAQILTVGNEGAHVKSLIEKYEEQKKEDRHVVKFGELSLGKLTVVLNHTENLDLIDEEISSAKSNCCQLFDLNNKLKNLDNLQFELTQLQNEITILESNFSLSGPLPTAPEIIDTTHLDEVLRKLDKSLILQSLSTNSFDVELPVLFDLGLLTSIGIRISKGITVNELLTKIESNILECPYPNLFEMNNLDNLISTLTTLNDSIKANEENLVQYDREYLLGTSNLNKFMSEAGGKCPLCGSSCNNNHFTGVTNG